MFHFAADSETGGRQDLDARLRAVVHVWMRFGLPLADDERDDRLGDQPCARGPPKVRATSPALTSRVMSGLERERDDVGAVRPATATARLWYPRRRRTPRSATPCLAGVSGKPGDDLVVDHPEALVGDERELFVEPLARRGRCRASASYGVVGATAAGGPRRQASARTAMSERVFTRTSVEE